MVKVSCAGRMRRLARLSRHSDGRYLIVSLDHSISDGPIATVERFDKLVGEVVEGGADGIVVHKAWARALDSAVLAHCALAVHLSGHTVHAPDIDAKVLVGDVEDAIRLGADAVSVHVNVAADLGGNVVKTVLATTAERSPPRSAASPR